MSVYSRALGAFGFRFGRGDERLAEAPAPRTRAVRTAANPSPAVAAVERGPGRYRRPTDGPTFRKLQALAETDPRAKAALDDVLAGRFSTTQAMIQLGLRKPHHHYRELLSVWGRASADARRDFLAHIRSEGGRGE